MMSEEKTVDFDAVARKLLASLGLGKDGGSRPIASSSTAVGLYNNCDAIWIVLYSTPEFDRSSTLDPSAVDKSSTFDPDGGTHFDRPSTLDPSAVDKSSTFDLRNFRFFSTLRGRGSRVEYNTSRGTHALVRPQADGAPQF